MLNAVDYPFDTLINEGLVRLLESGWAFHRVDHEAIVLPVIEPTVQGLRAPPGLSFCS